MIGLLFGCEEKKSEITAETITTDPQAKIAYSIGQDFGESLKRQGIEVNSDALIKGLKDVLSDAEPLISEDEQRDVLVKYQQDLQKQRADEDAKKSVRNKEEGEKFLVENGKKEGVVVLESGLQYKIIREGDGVIPTTEDKVIAHYEGRLLNGKVFDSSYERGDPVTFPVTGVIAGWTEALQIMPVGSKWELYIPSELAYEDRGVGSDIEPNSILIFTIELIEVKSPPK
ncbi:MAG: hypothetical protein B6244_13150 [Candidatus Cloacimonetes bacterium 4572_55]|nr:MAG: hypothetical protein B6244_13150 [Candidatus Cloacimonetes bacterium 4572_55]